jgi:hypothetical protein
MARRPLPQVTLCAVSSVNIEATLAAMEACCDLVEFGACKLLTHAPVRLPRPEIEVVPIEPLTSATAYSDFLLLRLADHIQTSHCLVVQWDGHILHADRWQDAFLQYDYVGASWPQFDDGHDVGNGGFSLRSRRLLDACRSYTFKRHHPEDVAICRTNRIALEDQGLTFAPREVADAFSAERASDPALSFGYHGVWNMPRAIGIEPFWRLYQTLDDRGSIVHDFWPILRSVGRGKGGVGRAWAMLRDRMSGD